MSWPTPASVLNTLPIRTFEDAEGRLLPSEVQRYIDKWRRELARGSDRPVAETPEAVDIVELGARADSLERLYTGVGYEQVRAAQGMRKEARTMLEAYKQEASQPGEAEHGTGTASVHNVTDEPLW